MSNFIYQNKGFVGFGQNMAEAKEDCYINMCMADISNDIENVFTQRKKELRAWLPVNGMLQIPGVCCISKDKYWLTEYKNNKSITINSYGYSLFTYLSELLPDEFSYSDICVCLKDEINSVFKNISPTFKLIEEFPKIMCINQDNGFQVITVYNLKDGVSIGVTADYIGLKFAEDKWYYAIDKTIMSNRDAISYIGYRMGIKITKKGEVIYIGEKD